MTATGKAAADVDTVEIYGQAGISCARRKEERRMRRTIEFAKGSMAVLGIAGFFLAMAAFDSMDKIGFGPTMGSGLGTVVKIWIALIGTALLLVIVLTYVERTMLKNMLRGLVERRDFSRSEDIQLAAPEAYILMRGSHARPGETFKLGLLQAVATGNVLVAGADQSATDLRKIATAPVGSLTALAGQGHQPITVQDCVERIKEKYGDPDGFVHQEVIPRLVSAGYATEYSGYEVVALTPEGERVKAVVEGRVGAALYEMQEQDGPSINADPRSALFAGVVMATAGMPMALAAAGAREVDETSIETDRRASSGYNNDGYMYNWYMFNSFDRAYTEVDSVGGDGGGDFGGGDGGDGGDGGGGD